MEIVEIYSFDNKKWAIASHETFNTNERENSTVFTMWNIHGRGEKDIHFIRWQLCALLTALPSHIFCVPQTFLILSGSCWQLTNTCLISLMFFSFVAWLIYFRIRINIISLSKRYVVSWFHFMLLSFIYIFFYFFYPQRMLATRKICLHNSMILQSNSTLRLMYCLQYVRTTNAVHHDTGTFFNAFNVN